MGSSHTCRLTHTATWLAVAQFNLRTPKSTKPGRLGELVAGSVGLLITKLFHKDLVPAPRHFRGEESATPLGAGLFADIRRDLPE